MATKAASTRFLRRFLLTIVYLLGLFGIVASGGGDDLSVEPDECELDEDVNGVWIDDQFGIAIISDCGWDVNIVSFIGDSQLSGRILVNDGEIYDSLVSLYGIDGSYRYFCGNTDSTFNYQDSININYSCPFSSDINLSLIYDKDLTERSSSLSLVSGIWSYSDGSGYTITLTVDDGGIFNGSDTSGCLYSGDLAVKDESINIYRVRLDQSGTPYGCSRYIPNATGQGILMDTTSSNDTLVIAVTGALASRVERLARQ